MIREIHKEFPTVPFIGEIPPVGIFQVAETIKGISLEKLRKVNQQSLDIVPFIDDIFNDGVLDGLLDYTFKYIIDCHIWGYIQKKKILFKILKNIMKDLKIVN